MERLSGRDIALTGIPRGGTTLACRLAGLADNAVALFEPMDVAAMPTDRERALSAVSAFFRDTREGLLRDGTAPSKLEGGHVPDNPFAPPGADGRRRLRIAHGRLRIDPPPGPGFTLLVKHNAAFIALLPELAATREVFAIVRNPLAVLASWASVELPVSDGRMPAGERLEPALAAALAQAPDRLARQLQILQWCFERFATALPRARVLRYEDIVATQGERLFAAMALRGRADAPLAGRNGSGAYRGFPAAHAASRLLAGGGAWREWYRDDEIDSLAVALGAAGAES